MRSPTLPVVLLLLLLLMLLATVCNGNYQGSMQRSSFTGASECYVWYETARGVQRTNNVKYNINFGQLGADMKTSSSADYLDLAGTCAQRCFARNFNSAFKYSCEIASLWHRSSDDTYHCYGYHPFVPSYSGDMSPTYNDGFADNEYVYMRSVTQHTPACLGIHTGQDPETAAVIAGFQTDKSKGGCNWDTKYLLDKTSDIATGQGCAAACLANKYCNFAQYQLNTNKCILMKQCSQTWNKDTSAIVFKKRIFTNGATAFGGVYFNSLLTSTLKSSYTDYSGKQCADLCNLDSGCCGFSFQGHTGTCRIFQTCSSSKTSSSATWASWVKTAF